MSNYGFGVPSSQHIPDSNRKSSYFDDMSLPEPPTQQFRRLSRSNGQQRSTANMRISKPSSATTSPNSSVMQVHRRALMNEEHAIKRQQQMLDYINTHYTADGDGAQWKPARPLSWHPTSQQPSNQTPPNHPLLTPSFYTDYQDMYMSAPQFSPMLDSYSSQTSPSSVFAPSPELCLGANTITHNVGMPGWDDNHKQMNYVQAMHNDELFSTFDMPATSKTSSNGSLDWTGFIMHGFRNTSPPTPEAFVQHQQTPINPQALAEDDEDDEGEILVGMGLYDTPDKTDEDPHLSNYRSTVSSLLGSSLRPFEPRGRGLKLEETWEPPKAEEKEENDEDDAEGDDEE